MPLKVIKTGNISAMFKMELLQFHVDGDKSCPSDLPRHSRPSLKAGDGSESHSWTLIPMVPRLNPGGGR